MLRKTEEEYHIPLLKRRKLINLLNEANFFIDGNHVYINNPQEGHPKIENCYLPVAFFAGRFSIKPVNKDEPYFKKYHDKIRDICTSLRT